MHHRVTAVMRTSRWCLAVSKRQDNYVRDLVRHAVDYRNIVLSILH